MRTAMLLLFVLVPTVLCAQWRQVGTVMQLDQLPATATHLEPQRLDPEFLEFVAELPQLRALRFPADESLPEASLKVLARSPGLEYLDLSGVDLDFELSPKIPELLAPCKSLKRLRIDLLQDLTFWCGNDGLTDEARHAAYKQVVLDLLARLAYRWTGYLSPASRVEAFDGLIRRICTTPFESCLATQTARLFAHECRMSATSETASRLMWTATLLARTVRQHTFLTNGSSSDADDRGKNGQHEARTLAYSTTPVA